MWRKPHFHSKIKKKSKYFLPYFIYAAAHCIKQKGSPVSKAAKNIKVLLGAYNISEANAFLNFGYEASGILVHSGWNSSDYFQYSNDIALVKLKREIEEFTPSLQPICLAKTTDISGINHGIVTGYGQFNESRITSDIPLKVELPIVDYNTWITKQWELAKVYWSESFTAGKETAGVCPGDSGSGFYVKSNGRYYLRGIVSSAIHGTDYNCTHNNFAIYTDVLKYMDTFILPVSLYPEELCRILTLFFFSTLI